MSQTNTQNVCPSCGGPGYHVKGCQRERAEIAETQFRIMLNSQGCTAKKLEDAEQLLEQTQQELNAANKAANEAQCALDLISRIKLVLGIDLSIKDGDAIIEKCRGILARLSAVGIEREKDREEWTDLMEHNESMREEIEGLKEKLKSIRSIIEQPTEVPQLSLYEIDQIAESALQAIRSTKE